jgi:Carboxypeptidase regulatory-like domain
MGRVRRRLLSAATVLRVQCLVVGLSAVVSPLDVCAQSASTGALTGTVTDPTGAVLQHAQITLRNQENNETRAGVTDAEGKYKIVDLRPGTYNIRFSLTGFSTVERQGVELSSGFTANVNAELKIGVVTDTITVSGATPVVDVQNASVQSVLSHDALSSMPLGWKTNYSFNAMTPGVVTSAFGQDVGGNQGELDGSPEYHGVNSTDSRYKIDGMDYNSFHGVGGGALRLYYINAAAVDEVNMGLGALSAEYETGGVQVNYVPKAGGNRYSLIAVAAYSSHRFQSDNLSSELTARGLKTAPKINRSWEYSAAAGGPVRHDKIWFFAAPRWWGTDNQLTGFYNATQHTPFYTPDLSRPAVEHLPNWDIAGRVTWQITPTHRVSVSHNEQKTCNCSFVATPTIAPEFFVSYHFRDRLTQATWSHTAGPRLLFQAGMSIGIMGQTSLPTGDVTSTDISTIDIGSGYLYRAAAGTGYFSSTGGAFYNSKQTHSNPLYSRFSVSYVAGSHALKLGITEEEGWHEYNAHVNQSLQYIFFNRTPILLTQFADPFSEQLRLRNIGLFVQDQWTLRKLTLNVGLRYDYLKGWIQPQDIPAGRFVGARSFGKVDNVPNFKDVNPRVSAAYDLLGNGKTAIKASFGRYVSSQGLGLTEQNNPALLAVPNTSRQWTDANGNYTPDCNLNDFATNGECGPVFNNLFGTVVRSTTYANDVILGWGHRTYTWQGSMTFQHELRPGLSATVGYFRNWYGNILVNVNQALTPADFSSYCVTAPQDPRLPGGGGNQVCGNVDVNPDKLGQVSTLIEQASDLHVGDVTRVYDGVDAGLTGRFRKVTQLAGGVSFGRTSFDDCALNGTPQAFATGYGWVENGIEVALGGGAHPLSSPYCHVRAPWSKTAQVKISGIFSLPYGFEVAGVFQNLPGHEVFTSLVANACGVTTCLAYTDAQVSPALGRNLSTGSVVIPIVPPHTMFEDRLTQLDLRVTKVLQFGAEWRVKAHVDLYNVLNSNTVTGVNSVYGPQYLTVQQIMTGRFARLGVQIDF